MDQQRIAKLVCFGKGGFTVYFSCGSIMRGYGGPETFDVFESCPDGTPVLDKRPAVETAEGAAWAFKGPLIDVDLEDDEVNSLGDVDDCGPMAGEMIKSGGAFGTLLQLHSASQATATKPGPLDRISVTSNIRGWRDHGAVYGEVHGERFDWE